MRQCNQLPCLDCQPQRYIRVVQHLIERCLLLHMTREECVQALARRAGIKPLITATVWEELMKENRGFFRSYFRAFPRKHYQENYQEIHSIGNDRSGRGGYLR